MTATFTQARDEMFALVKTAWDAGTAAIVGYVPYVHWQGVEVQGKQDGSKYWARVSKQTVDSEQTSLSMNVGEEGKRRYNEYGIIFIQLFCPKSQGDAEAKGGELAEFARAIFRGVSTENCVWFKNARINEVPAEDLFHRFNVVAEFEYDEVT